MSRAKPSRQEIAASLRYYDRMRVEDGEPPPNESAAGPDETETAVDEAGDEKLTTRPEALEEFRKAKLAFDHAVVGCLAGDPHAEAACDDALRQLSAAREALKAAE